MKVHDSHQHLIASTRLMQLGDQKSFQSFRTAVAGGQGAQHAPPSVDDLDPQGVSSVGGLVAFPLDRTSLWPREAFSLRVRRHKGAGPQMTGIPHRSPTLWAHNHANARGWFGGSLFG